MDKYAPNVQRLVAKVYGQARVSWLFLLTLIGTSGCRHTRALRVDGSLAAIQEAEQRLALARASVERGEFCPAKQDAVVQACDAAHSLCGYSEDYSELAARCRAAQDGCTTLRLRVDNEC